MRPGWAAVGPAPGEGFMACAMHGPEPGRTATGTSEAEALDAAGVKGGRVVRVDHGPALSLPAPILPESGPDLPPLAQEQPRDLVSGWLRLRVAGALAEDRNWDGVICAAEGGVSHWLHVSANEVVSSRGFLTWRLVTALGGAPDRADMTALTDSLSRPAQLAADLRSAELGGDTAAMTGHLIGAELAAARPYWLGQEVIVVHPSATASSHARALTAQGVPVSAKKPDRLLGKGLGVLGMALGLS
ncbi:2-dehydro-3-deoxygalactonokinase [Roseovarius sp. TE539]|uniref:2-dehydro-3-deoxygalactonokinase n=1 Tax=Roseovarius sp. TE539 TaxID=2249812 RepID=UPI000DE06B62|nr:2-dehydro-3-deoxygalactonokinase [Roseovarius sp. TE539]RBI73980.1 2-dehydro-3-deoxygalactonokinase [Roseovarius sp. TE539]